MITLETVDKILNKEIIPFLTDMTGNQEAFWNVFKFNKENNIDIKTVLELGIMRLKLGVVPVDLPGQSTKILYTLCDHYGADKHVSLDIDAACKQTTDRCKQWVSKFGVEVKNHKFVASNSIHYKVEQDFPNGVDFIFLDTNHDDVYPEKVLKFKNSGGAGMTYREICYYAKHLTENGRLFLHDTKNFYLPRAYGVNTEGAVQRFLDENKEFDFIEHGKNQHGLGEIFKKESKVAEQYAKN